MSSANVLAYLKTQLGRGLITTQEYVRFCQDVDKENAPPDQADVVHVEDEDEQEDEQEEDEHDNESNPGESNDSLGDSQGSSNTEAKASKKRAREAKSFWNTHLGQPARCAKIRKVPMLPKSVGTARSRRTQGMRRDDVSSQVARGRLEEFQGEGFVMENNNIVCTGCGMPAPQTVTGR